jgi:hypothetical protein
MDDAVWTYVAPDGAAHTLIQETGTTNEYRTHDGSHLRAFFAADGWILDFPNGVTYELRHEVARTVKEDLGYTIPPVICDPPAELGDAQYFVTDSSFPANSLDRDWVGWFTTKVYSRADVTSPPLSFQVSYQDAVVSGDPAGFQRFAYIAKTVTDQFGRAIQITVDTSAPSSPTFGLITSVTTPAPASAAGQPRTATYTFSYIDQTLSIPAYGGPFQHPVKLLERVTGPTGYSHRYTYTTSGSEGQPSYLSTYIGGQIKAIEYPTGKKEVYGYRHYSYTQMLSGCPRQRSSESPKWGLASKTVYVDGNDQNSAPENKLEWTLTQTKELYRQFDCPREYDQLHSLRGPDGNVTAMLFHTPWSKLNRESYGRLRENRVYKGDAATGTLVRVEKHAYAAPLDTTCYPDREDYVLSKTTEYWDDLYDGANPTTFVEENLDPDNFGHFERVRQSGNGLGPNPRVLRTDYAINNTAPGGAECAASTALKVNWFLNVVNSSSVSEEVSGVETRSRLTEFGFDTSRGLITSVVKRLDPSTAGPAHRRPGEGGGVYGQRGSLVDQRVAARADWRGGREDLHHEVWLRMGHAAVGEERRARPLRVLEYHRCGLRTCACHRGWRAHGGGSERRRHLVRLRRAWPPGRRAGGLLRADDGRVP